MSDELQQWIQRVGKRAIVDGYNVDGFQFESVNGERAWHITAWPGRDPISSYWVARGKFYSMRIHYFYNMTNESRIEVFGEIESIRDDERAAVLKAISDWEKSIEVEAI